MAREKKVVDASVLVKLFLHEENDDKALALVQDHIAGKALIIVPELVFLEVINALRYKKQDVDALDKANQRLWKLQFHVEKMNAFLLKRTAELALEFNLTVYDALYVAVANNFGAPLITADKALGKVPNVVLLSSL